MQKFSVGDIVEYQASHGWHERDSLNGAIGIVSNALPKKVDGEQILHVRWLFRPKDAKYGRNDPYSAISKNLRLLQGAAEGEKL